MNKKLTVIILSSILHSIALYSSRPYISLLATSHYATTIQVGFILSMYSIIQVACSMLISKVINTKGERVPAVFGASLFFIGCLGLALSKNLIHIGFFTILLGLGHGSILISCQYITTNIVDIHERNKAVGYYSFTNSIGFFLGPILGGVLQDTLGPNQAFFGPAIISLLCIGVMLGLPKDSPSHLENNDYNPVVLLKNRDILKNIIISATVFFAVDVINTYLPLFGVEIGLTVTTVGIVMGLNGIAQMLIRPFMGAISGRFTKDLTFFICLLVGGLSLMSIGFTHSFWQLGIAGILSGITIGLANPLTLVNVTEIATMDTRSQVLALRVMGNYVGQTASPILFGLLATASGGFASVFWASGAVMIVCAYSQSPKTYKHTLAKKK